MAGVFTRDFRENHLTCQILVTVPACLGILFLSAERADWVGRIQYIIFDEIHCMGAAEGEIWEQILLLNQAPFLALSATLGNTREFHEWLSKVEEHKGSEVRLITHRERWNDLALNVFDSSNKRIAKVPSCFALDASHVNVPADLKLIPEECFQIFQNLSEYASKHPKEAEFAEKVRKLDPSVFFQSNRSLFSPYQLSMTQVAEWECRLKEMLNSLTEAVAKPVLEPIIGPPTAIFENEASHISHQYLFKNVITLLDSLKEMDILPSIVFHMGRITCEKLVLEVTASVQRKEAERRASAAWRSKEAYLKQRIEACSKDRAENERERSKNKQDQVEAESALLEHLKADPNSTYLPSGKLPPTQKELEESLRHDFDPEDPLIQGTTRNIHPIAHEFSNHFCLSFCLFLQDYWLESRVITVAGTPSTERQSRNSFALAKSQLSLL